MKRLLYVLPALLLAMGTDARAVAPDPYQIFEHARQVWVSQRYPDYVSYTIAVTVLEKGVQKASHYRASYDALHDKVFVDPVSAEEKDHPHVPVGTNMTLEPKRNWMTLFKKHVGTPEDSVDYLGVPMLAPNYSFGIAPYVPPLASSQADQAALVQEVRRQFNDPIASSRTDEIAKISSLKEIGRVVTANRDYTITYDGLEPVDGRDAYHISLRPTRTPDRLRLREMWIDAQSFATCKVVSSGNFTNNGAPWTVTFVTVDNAQYIASEYTSKPIRAGLHTYDEATVSFEGITPSQWRGARLDSIGTPTNVLTEPH